MIDLMISRAQLLAGALVEPSLSSLRAGLQALVDAVPISSSIWERLVIHVVVSQVIGHVLESPLLNRRSDIANTFIAWTASSTTSAAWRLDLCNLLSLIASALTDELAAEHSTDLRVIAAMRLIQARFADPSFTRQDCAHAMNLSVWHASHLLKQQTGCGFVTHIHRHRAETTQTLLRETDLSVKQIAAAVGYGSASQLGRHFKRLHGITPLEFRRSAYAAQPAE